MGAALALRPLPRLACGKVQKVKLGHVLVFLATSANGKEDSASVWTELGIAREAEGLQVIGSDEAAWHDSMILGKPPS